MTVQAICFDMDGVILEGRGTDPEIYAQAADAALDDLDVDLPEPSRRALREHGYGEVETHCSAFDVDPVVFWRLKEAHASRLSHERIRSGDRGVYEDVDAIRPLASETPLALVTNNRQATAEFVTEHFDLPFDVVRGRDPLPEGFRRRKPRPDYLLEALDELSAGWLVPVRSGIYVGDRASDVLAAVRAGLEAAYLRRPHNENEPLPAGAAYELSSLEELVSISSCDVRTGVDRRRRSR